MINKKFLIALAFFSFIFANSANAAFFSGKDLITPDSSLSFLQTWKESIQTFFTFGLENKAKQYLHLADVRLNEYKNMIEQGKTDIAGKVLEKYQKQLNNALEKAKEMQDQGKDIKDLSQKIEGTVTKHLEVLQNNLQKVPEQARQGIENAIESSQEQLEEISGLRGGKPCTEEAKVCPDGSTVGRTGPNCEFVPCPQKGCVGAGEEMSPKEYGRGGRCCVGLTQIKTSRYFYPCDNPGKNACDENGCSIPPPTSDESPWWQCTLCGNGKCEPAYGENKCNCPKDCK